MIDFTTRDELSALVTTLLGMYEKTVHVFRSSFASNYKRNSVIMAGTSTMQYEICNDR
jgi:hypothetical protein